MSWTSWIAVVVMLSGAVEPLAAQEMPADYKGVLTTLGKNGDFKDGVLKVNIPRGDLSHHRRPLRADAVRIRRLGGADEGGRRADVMMGDLVLTEDEVNPVMSAILDHGLDVTALHNHFFWEQPRIFYMHVHGMGNAADLADCSNRPSALDDKASAGPRRPPTAGSAPTIDGARAGDRSSAIQGEQTGAVYKITIGRPDLDVREHGASINARMGLNTWAAFAGTDTDAMVAGDVAMLARELTPVLQALRANGLDVVAIHHHMTGVTPMIVSSTTTGPGRPDAGDRRARRRRRARA